VNGVPVVTGRFMPLAGIVQPTLSRGTALLENPPPPARGRLRSGLSRVGASRKRATTEFALTS